MATSTAQFIRAYKLLVYSTLISQDTGTFEALDLSELHFKFTVQTADVETPNKLTVRVYNLRPDTVAQLKRPEFSQITLEAGYQNNVNYGIIFKGDIKRVNTGKESNVDSYVEILAADGDLVYNFGFVNTNLAAGATMQDQLNKILPALGGKIDKPSLGIISEFGGVLPRGTVLFGFARAQMRDLCAQIGARWSIVNGVVTIIPLTGYLPGEAVILNSLSGLIGQPQVTDNGINARCLLNAKLRIGGLIKINQNDINQELVQAQGFANYSEIYLPAQTNADGYYRLLSVEYTGDTRGGPWYSDIICLNVDISAPSGSACQAYPGTATPAK